MTRLLVTDLDATIVFDRSVSPADREAMARWRAAGNLLAVDTGKSSFATRDVLGPLGVDFDYGIVFTGAVLIDSSYRVLSARYLPDQLPNKQGALSAIAPALAQAQAQGYAGLYILSCDTLIPPEALIAQLNTAAASPAFTQGITALQDGDQLLPLLAHWSAHLAGSLKTAVAQGNKRVQHYVKSQPHQTLPLPPQWRSIAHFNTPQEYEQAQHTAQQLNIYADAEF